MSEDDAQLRAHGLALAEAVRTALPDWVERCVRERCEASGVAYDEPVRSAAREAAAACSARVGDELVALLTADPDDQRGTPLTLLRQAVRYPTEVLAAAGVPPVDRDDFARRAFPDDRYDLSPASFEDVDPALRDPGIAWGAARAWVHHRRHAGGE